MKTSIYIVSLISVYLIGIVTNAIWDGNHKTEGASHDQPAELAGSEAPRPSDTGAGQPTDAPINESQTDDERLLALQPIVIEAILNGGKLEEQLLMMGLTEEDVEGVLSIQASSNVKLVNLDKDHSKVVSDEKGEYVVIEPFPEERRAWLESLESDVHELINDDRAAVITRMIAFTDMEDTVGIYRREVFFKEPSPENEQTLIEERFFDEDGKQFDSDYGIATPSSSGRWGHLLDLGGDE